MKEYTYIAIDLKSFYASVECVERNLDPLTTNLVVADPTRTDKTICLAVSPAMKSYGVPGRPRLFEVIQKVKRINEERRKLASPQFPVGKSIYKNELDNNHDLELDYITAPPRMALYIKYSSDIYNVYLKYISHDDIHVYSIDEVFIDVTSYLNLYKKNAYEISMMIIRDILATTGITATCGIGTNLYLCKVAMDIVAKKMPPDKDGVRIAELNELSYREQLWEHTPIRDFWRVGSGYARKLEQLGLRTMGDVALFSLTHEDVLYRLFGVNAELLIDHAWGWESCTIDDIKSYRPRSRSLSEGQVLSEPTSSETALIIVQEMADKLALRLVEHGYVCKKLVLTVCYDAKNISDATRCSGYHCEIVEDHYGRKIPKHSHGTITFKTYSSSSRTFIEYITKLFYDIVDSNLLIRKLYICSVEMMKFDEYESKRINETSLITLMEGENKEISELRKENNRQKTILRIHDKYGANALLKGLNLKKGATARQRNTFIGGHKA